MKYSYVSLCIIYTFPSEKCVRAQEVVPKTVMLPILLNLAADCFPARNCGPSVSMVITGRSRHYCVSSSQSICYKLVYRKIEVRKFPKQTIANYI